MWELYHRLPLPVVAAAGADSGPDVAAFDAAASLRILRLPLDFTSWGVMRHESLRAYLRTFAQLQRTMRETPTSQIHCAKALPEGLLGAGLGAAAGVPFTCFAHGEELRLASTSRELRTLTRWVLHRAARVIANSTFTRDVLLDEWSVPREHVAVLHPGVDTSRFRPALPDTAARERLGWTGRQVVLTVGTMQKRKGQDTMIRALPAIRSACPSVLYAMAGPEVERPYLESLAQDLGVRDAVQFLGNADEDLLLTCYQQCDLFALPCRQIGWDVEGFGMVLVEAQACGKPVLAGRSGGTADTLEDGVTGHLVSGDVTSDLEIATIALLRDPMRRARMGLSARRRAEAHFDWAPLVRDAMDLFETNAPTPATGALTQLA